ncbi:MAG: putative toxin-antitoxin system toxin component, PIN family [Candidatus Electrothrix sp. MAN1_4]|nr:putative toxin-antitoxin system toxin component, PIN family [Candidatus Electrothrix sp. MAN1_4]
MNKIKLIMDTNVLFAGLYSSTGASYQILKLIDNDRITPVISTTLLFEYEDVLKRKQKELGLSGNEIDVVLDNICALSEFQKIYFLWRPYLKDPKDDHVLEVAVASKTKMIVTHNMKDFKGVEKFGVTALRPGKLLEAIQ